ncbi:MAG TPA: hypothetical protein VNC41_14870 [Acidimicrobiia bacterium]|nr:hypothetical protein [Acidimicrobiia bacterium]
MGQRRIRTLGVLVAPFAVAGMVMGTAALGADTAKPKPSIEVVPATGLKYGQTVTVKGHHLPKGSGSVAATICGLTTASGKTIAKPTPDDCAGANELGTLVVLKQWQSNGEFETKYTLPASGKKFGKNQRYCDKTHHCALVVADANPDAPAYHVEKVIQFVDQKPFGASTSPTTKPKPKPTPTTKPQPNPAPTTKPEGSSAPKPAAQPGVVADGTGDADMNPDNPKLHFEGSIGFHPPSGGAPTLPALPTPGGDGAPQLPPEVTNALDQVCTQIAAAVKQAGGDTTALTTACASIKNGNGPEQLKTVLQSPNLLCVLGASAWQNNQQVTDACNQAATALKPALGPLVGALDPVLGSL